jgi:hypothetical protein
MSTPQCPDQVVNEFPVDCQATLPLAEIAGSSPNDDDYWLLSWPSQLSVKVANKLRVHGTNTGGREASDLNTQSDLPLYRWKNTPDVLSMSCKRSTGVTRLASELSAAHFGDHLCGRQAGRPF